MELINLLIFFMATTGLTLILTKSKLFSATRKNIATQRAASFNKKATGLKTKFWWWLDSIFECYMCMSVYTGIIVTGIIWLSLYFPWAIWTLYPFAGVPVASVIIQHWEKINRKI